MDFKQTIFETKAQTLGLPLDKNLSGDFSYCDTRTVFAWHWWKEAILSTHPEVIDVSNFQVVKETPSLNLNDQQTAAFDKILYWWEHTVERGFILKGFAGTGKTFLIRSLAPHLSKGLGRIVFCAPTNKATNEVRKQVPGYDCMTIYSLLGLKMEQVEDKLVLTKSERTKLGRYSLVVLDECGMINKELREYIKESMAQGVRYLFIGDPKQLNPIGERRSLIWKDWDSALLTKVERHDNQILTLSTYLRSTSIEDLEFYNDNDGKQGVWYLPFAKFERKIQNYARAGGFDTECRAMAWRNKTVDRLNELIRYEIFGRDSEHHRYLKNDRIVFTGLHEIDGRTITTDEDGIITDISFGEHHLGVKYYSMTIQSELDQYLVKVVHENSERRYEQILNALAQKARQYPREWKTFWAFKGEFAPIRHGFALTVHRMQGSTVKNAFVDVEDILKNSNSAEALRCCYVACTRPTTSLYLA